MTEQAWSIKDLCVLYGIKQHQKIDKFSLRDKLSIPSEQDSSSSFILPTHGASHIIKYTTIFLFFVSFTAWVGSVGIALVFTLGPLTSALVNQLGCRLTAIIGGLSCVIGLLLSSLATSIYILYLTYSVLFGFGGSCLFVSSYVIISMYFEKRRFIAAGTLASGTGLGVFIVAPILQALLDSFDWRKTYRITAGITSVACVLCLTFDATVVTNSKKGKNETHNGQDEDLENQDKQEEETTEKPNKWIDLSVFKEKVFVVLTLSFALALLGHHIPRLHLVRIFYILYKKAPKTKAKAKWWHIKLCIFSASLS